MAPHTILVIANPAARHLRLLEQLPAETRLAVGESPEAFANLAAEANIILNGGHHAETLERVFAMAPNVQWVHSLSAGVDKLLFPALKTSPVPLTNSRGVYSRSLAEWGVLAMLFFAKDVRRLLRQQAAAQWEQFDCLELRGQTLGVIGYGSIGQETAVRAKAFGMKIHALRRRPDLSASDPVVDKSYGPDQLLDLMAASDYVLMSLPLTRGTTALVGERELRAMKKTGVLINLGRGSSLVEAGLARALQEGWIHGAALDVFETEPLAASSPLWGLQNLLLSPHSADHTDTWQDESMQFFVDNFGRWDRGEALENIVDKSAGY